MTGPVPDGGDLVRWFDRRAAAYDRGLPLGRRALRAAARLAGPVAGRDVVDLATGTGALAAALAAPARRVRARSSIAGAASTATSDAGRPRAARAADDLRVMRADARAVPMPGACADLVAIGYLLHLLGDADGAAVLAEARRLLRPGGRLVVVVHAPPRGPAGPAYRAAWRLAARLRPDDVVGGGPMPDLRRRVAAAGLVVEVAHRVAGPWWSEVVRARAPARPPGP